MEFTRERLQIIADEANDLHLAYKFIEKIKKEMEALASKGYYHYITEVTNMPNLKEIITYFESKGFEVIIDVVDGWEYLKIYWN